MGVIMRKLASIQKIVKLESIKGKDYIEVATILGWTVIVQKGFKVGDLCIYIEYDSILPERKEFEFLRKRCYSDKYQGYRIRCMKMAGIYSQGIVFKIDELLGIDYGKWPEGKDVTDILKIRKYDPNDYNKSIVKQRKSKNPVIRFLMRFKIFRNILLKAHIKIPFPSHLCSKTDETRIQAIPFILEEFKRELCYITEKLDGCSATYVWDKGKFLVCSRNMVTMDKKSHYWKIAEKYNLKEKLKNTGLCIQGEIIGPGVGNAAGRNIYQLKEVDFYIFNIIDKKTRKCLPGHRILNKCNQLRLKYVPYLGDCYIGEDDVQGLLEKAKGKSKIFDVEREGIVIRDINNKCRSIRNVGDSLSFKAINPDYMLKYCNKE